jgi:sodium-dependent dicarboxylate transporter 2/3/5
MAHTAVAATIYPLLVSIYALYGEGENKTRFGKGLFIGMAYVAGAGSIVTLLGAARGAVALGFYKDIMNVDITFFQLTWYMFPIGWIMTFLLWGFFMVFFKPEKATIPGLREKAKKLNDELGGMTRNEIMAAAIVGICILIMAAKQFLPALAPIDKTAIILVSTIMFFITGIMDLDDLEAIPWNIILLFAGAMSIGNCLWQTGAANWMAVNWLAMFQEANWFVFVMSIAFFVMIMTNVIMNVAAIAISLPVALVIAPYLGVAGEVILFSALVTAGMPFLLLVGAAPNAIAYDSKQFTTAEFFLYGIPASVILMVVTGFAVFVLWPLMGMPVTLPPPG